MFKSLIYAVFPSLKSEEHSPNFEYFEQTRFVDDDSQSENAITANQRKGSPPLAINVISTSDLFMSYLFGDQAFEQDDDQLSQYVTDKVDFLLQKNSKALLESLPVMPATVTLLINELKSDDFNTQVLIDSINTEPTIAAEVINLANSAKYRRGDKEVADIKAAFMSIGKNGLLEGVIYHYINDFRPTPNVYYRQFGTKIWQHCHQTAEITQALICRLGYKELSATAYFLGLIKNLGHMVIFQLMTDAFSCIDPSCSPNSKSFKQLIEKYSLRLTYTIARQWKLPEVILTAIALLADTRTRHQLALIKEQHPLAFACFEANRISELKSLKQANLLNEEIQNEAVVQSLLGETIVDYLG